MSDYTKEFEDYWYKPLYESAKSNGGIPDKDMMRYKDLGKQPAFDAWMARGQEITRLKKALDLANEAIGFYADRMSYSFDDYMGVSGEMRSRVILYGDSTEVNDVSSYAGRRAREAQKQIKELMEGAINEIL